jgi:hypothetical protein
MSMAKIFFDDKVNQKGDGQGYRTGTVPTFYKKSASSLCLILVKETF